MPLDLDLFLPCRGLPYNRKPIFACSHEVLITRVCPLERLNDLHPCLEANNRTHLYRLQSFFVQPVDSPYTERAILAHRRQSIAPNITELDEPDLITVRTECRDAVLWNRIGGACMVFQE